MLLVDRYDKSTERLIIINNAFPNSIGTFFYMILDLFIVYNNAKYLTMSKRKIYLLTY